jgi:hypothetical protein
MIEAWVGKVEDDWKAGAVTCGGARCQARIKIRNVMRWRSELAGEKKTTKCRD